jgi:hypothetical protein
MTVQNITVSDPDSLDAASDIVSLREDYGSYLARYADELAAESGITADDYDGTDFDPDDPSPVTPAAIPGSTCRECSGSGTRRFWTGGGLSAWIEEACRACDGTGTTPVPSPSCHRAKLSPHPAFLDQKCWLCNGSGHDAAGDFGPPTVVPFDRAAHCRKIASYGGMATLATYGVAHFRAIGHAGARTTIERHGRDYFFGVAGAKGWTGRRAPDLLADLAAGRQLAALAA